ncbi:hypothetical protein FRC14_005429 [Serendipita sp. 396]|nr:hypothetical protein FRC14_005429 [Serendipita sp. 396]KAG8865873.1 hypothetical protein FRC20_009327 [Serendipita sp. 405]KAG9052195.1 hypothetical protein FS842_010343 [Serendipita sp. 407]
MDNIEEHSGFEFRQLNAVGPLYDHLLRHALAYAASGPPPTSPSRNPGSEQRNGYFVRAQFRDQPPPEMRRLQGELSRLLASAAWRQQLPIAHNRFYVFARRGRTKYHCRFCRRKYWLQNRVIRCIRRHVRHT